MMMSKLQQIEDHYFAQGLRGEKLRKALADDKEYQTLLKKRRLVIRNKFGISEEEERAYQFPNEEDYEIFSIIKSLESKNLSSHDKEIVEVIKSQLKADWREPLLEKLKQLIQKYY